MTALDDDTRPRGSRRGNLLLEAFQASPYGVLITDSRGSILLTNRAFSRITGYAADEVRGRNPRLLQSGLHDARFYRRMWQVLEREGLWQGEIRNRRKDGALYLEWLTITAVKDRRGRGRHYVGVFRDITDRKAAEARLTRMAYSDSLTGLPNRTLFYDRLSQALAQGRRNRWGLAVLLLDLDDFKSVNDVHGHLAGDSVLQEVARRLSDNLRDCDTVARSGGDEFVVVLPHIERPDDALEVCRKLLASLEPDFRALPAGYLVGASLGVSVYPDDAHDAEDLIRKADQAMYLVKRRGKSGFCRWSPVSEREQDRDLRSGAVSETARRFAHPAGTHRPARGRRSRTPPPERTVW